MKDKLEDLMKNKTLTKTEEKIAKFFLKNTLRLPALNSKNIANEIEVSDTSVIRFIKYIGFVNFKDFKDFIKNELEKKNKTPRSKLEKSHRDLKYIKLEDLFYQNITENIKKIFIDENLSKINKMVSKILKSRRKYIVGFKSVGGVVSFLGLRLGFLLEEVYSYRENSSELLKQFVDINEEDLLILICYPKYSKTYDLLIEYARSKKAKVVIITNSMESPYFFKGDINIELNTNGITYFNSIASLQILAELVLTKVSENSKDSEKKRLETIDYLLELKNNL